MNRKGLYDEDKPVEIESGKENGKEISDKENRELTREIDYQFDIEDSVIYIFDEITEFTTFDFITRARLILRNRSNEKANEPINIILNSPGGSVYDMNGLIDYMKTLSVPVNIIVRGKAMSAAAVILAAATGKRYASKRSTIMFHEASSMSIGKQSDLKANVKHIGNMENDTNILLGEVTKKSADWWEKEQKTDLYLNAQEALELGVIDEII
tara:strand:- start:1514 stop:2149 length:636 start_codon:yes stop_codon:yes gene_type:complete